MFQITITILEKWNTGGNGEITIKNISGKDLDNWELPIEFNVSITNFWNLEYDNNIITAKPWNTLLKNNDVIKSGFSYTGIVNEINYIILQNNQNNLETIDEKTETSEIIIGINNDIEQKLKKKVIGYFTEWSIYQRGYSVEQIPVNNLTHISYAFMLPNPSQEDYNTFKNNSRFPPLPYRAPPEVPEASLVFHDEYAGLENIRKLQKLKQENNHLKIGISIGGWTLSWTFSKIAASQVLRKIFIESSVDFIIEKEFDYLSIDWEFPGKQGIGFNAVDEINDGKNLLLLLKEMREYMDLKSPNKRLEITAASGIDTKTLKHYKGAEKYLDSLELMTYDMSGPWDKDTNYHTHIYHNSNNEKSNPQFCGDYAVKYAIGMGFKPEQLCYGCAFYSRGWDSVTLNNENNNEIFGISNGQTTGTLSGDYGEPGMSSYRDIIKEINNGTFTEYYDEISKASWCKNNDGMTLSFDSKKTIKDKVDYVYENNMGGFLIWELSDDVRNNNNLSLLYSLKNNIQNYLQEEAIPNTPNIQDEIKVNEPIVEEYTDDNEPELSYPTNEVATNTETENHSIEITIKNTGTNDIVIKPGELIIIKKQN